MTTKPKLRTLSRWTALAAIAVAAACSSDSPTEPTPSPGPPPGSGGGGTTFNVTVSASPGTVAAGSDDPVIVTVRATRTDNGQPAANGTIAVITATEGSFEEPGGPTSVSVNLTNGSAQVQYFPPTDEAGAVTVRASVAGSVGSTTLTVTEAEAFFISFVDPNVGTPSGGEEAFIHGSGFEEPVRVNFGNANARVLSVSPTRIRVIVPESPGQPNERLTVPVTVTINVNQEDQASDTLPGAFTYAPGGSPDQPTILSLTPATGPNEGGTRVLINGSGFDAPVQVELCAAGTCLEAQVVNVISTQIEFITPSATGFGQALQNQTVDVRVRNLDSGLLATFADAFRYGAEIQVTGIQPGRGTYTGGTLVTVFGSGFDAPVRVSIGEVPQEVISVTGTEIVIRTVAVRVDNCSVAERGFGQNAGPVRVVNVEGGAEDVGPSFEFLIPVPVIFSVSPTSGPEAGGTTVTIRGTGFESPVRVLFGSQAATVISASPDEIVIRTPRFTGSFPTQECQTAEGGPGVRFIPASVAITEINLATDCQDILPNAFAYEPTDTTCRATTTPAPPVEADFSFTVSGQTVLFNNSSSGNIDSQLWNFGDGEQSTEENPTHSYAAPGTYSVQLTVQGDDGSDSVTKDVTVP